MIFTKAMNHLAAIVLDEDADKVTESLLRLGVTHFIGVSELSHYLGDPVKEMNVSDQGKELSEARKRIESLLGSVGERPAPETAAALKAEGHPVPDLNGINRRLDKLGNEMRGVRERQGQLQKEILKLEDIRRQLASIGDVDMGVAKGRYSFLDIKAGTIPAAKDAALDGELAALPCVKVKFSDEGDRVGILLVAMKRDSRKIGAMLDKNGWADMEISREISGGGGQAAIDKLDADIQRLRSEQEDKRRAAGELVAENRQWLDESWEDIRVNELLTKIKSNFGRTGHTLLFSGWVPGSEVDKVAETIAEVTGGRAYIEIDSPEEARREYGSANVPVQFANPAFLAPFEMLVQNYSVPEYGTIDPTPFVGIAYMAMFGLMFGDAGHGAVIALLGILCAALFKNQGHRKLGKLLIWCGGAATIAGVLFGSYFGMQWFKPLWFDYHGAVTGHAGGDSVVHDVYGILGLTIYFGIGVIGLGIVFNCVNHFIKRDWIELIFGKAGILGAWIYAGGICAAFHFVGHDYKALPTTTAIGLGVGLPAALMFLKGPFEHFAHHHGGLSVMSIFDFIMEWLVELLEVFSGYLANTLSFMRVAGLGIAHVSLMVAFFQIAGMVAGEDGHYGVASIAVLIVGNALVIGLEGLSAGIQSLRLNYYEFFSKFFSGGGDAYEPVKLK